MTTSASNLDDLLASKTSDQGWLVIETNTKGTLTRYCKYQNYMILPDRKATEKNYFSTSVVRKVSEIILIIVHSIII